MELIKLDGPNGLVTVVDDADYQVFGEHRWREKRCRGKIYAVEAGKPGVFLHREILGLVPGDGIIADHRNNNPLDNRRSNLRQATATQNAQNGKTPKTNTTGYKGVWLQRETRYRAGIRINKRTTHLGMFADPIDAAKAYDEAARKYHGEFALTNFPAPEHNDAAPV